MEVVKQQKHFVLVHGLGHGAWCWYKLKPLLEFAGHKVTALDLAASGINLKKIQELRTFYDYTMPLMEIIESLPQHEKVILVGHSLGGMNLALAMDKFPEMISAAVFVTALIPDTVHDPSYVVEQQTSQVSWLDSKIESYGPPEDPFTSVLFGPKFMASILYQLCSIEDLTLATTLVRPGSTFVNELKEERKFSNEGFGSVRRVYVVCKDDKAITEENQRWMIENSGVKEVKEIEGADHMAMLSKPRELCYRLLEIANN